MEKEKSQVDGKRMNGNGKSNSSREKKKIIFETEQEKKMFDEIRKLRHHKRKLHGKLKEIISENKTLKERSSRYQKNFNMISEQNRQIVSDSEKIKREIEMLKRIISQGETISFSTNATIDTPTTNNNGQNSRPRGDSFTSISNYVSMKRKENQLGNTYDDNKNEIDEVMNLKISEKNFNRSTVDQLLNYFKKQLIEEKYKNNKLKKENNAISKKQTDEHEKSIKLIKLKDTQVQEKEKELNELKNSSQIKEQELNATIEEKKRTIQKLKESITHNAKVSKLLNIENRTIQEKLQSSDRGYQELFREYYTIFNELKNLKKENKQFKILCLSSGAGNTKSKKKLAVELFDSNEKLKKMKEKNNLLKEENVALKNNAEIYRNDIKDKEKIILKFFTEKNNLRKLLKKMEEENRNIGILSSKLKSKEKICEEQDGLIQNLKTELDNEKKKNNS